MMRSPPLLALVHSLLLPLSFKTWRALLGTSLLLLPLTSTTAADLADCNANSPATTLAAVRYDMTLPASAHWRTANRIHWHNGPRADQYRLLQATDATLALQSGQPVRGADRQLTLTAQAAGNSSGQPTALSLTVPAIADTDWPQWLTGQVLLVALTARGELIAATHLQTAALLDSRYGDAAANETLGAQVGREQTRFRLWAPTAAAVHVCQYHDGSSKADAIIALSRDERSGIWQVDRRGDQRGRYYNYLVDVYAPNVGIVRNRVTDPYSLSLTTDSTRSFLVDLNDPSLKPAGWDSVSRPAANLAATDLMIYELHVRDFSINDPSVTVANRGKYLAFTELKSQGMQHLQALKQAGLTDIHLLPVFDFATVPEARCLTPTIAPASGNSRVQQAAVTAFQGRDCYNWGYDPFHYTAPEGSYASDARNGATRIRELRQLVMALHKLGLRVGMDVVYNHTSASGQDAGSVLDRIVPGYYQRLNADGAVETSTCCANTATEHRMMTKLMIDSAVVWARDYRIDSFRFDLMGHQPRAAMEQLQQAVNAATGRHIHLIGEGWNFGEVANGARFVQASQLSLNGSGIGTFSDRARDAVRGGSAGDSAAALIINQGFINGLHYAPNALSQGRHSRTDLLRAADLVRVGLAGSLRTFRLPTSDDKILPLAAIDYAGQPAGYVSEPGEVVNYVENHDNQTLFDANVLKLPLDTSREDRARVQILAAATVAFSQGIAYFHAGQDILRSKSLDRNSFDSGDWFNRLDWHYQDNYFATGLPPERDNGASWDLMSPYLEARTAQEIKPRTSDIIWTRDAFRDLLRIRASSTLFRLNSAAEIERRLQFLNTGSGQEPTVIIGKLNGQPINGEPVAGANFKAVLYAINVARESKTLPLPSERGQRWQLHPVHQQAGATDRRPRNEARFDADTGTLTVPARTAVVFVIP
ncbi:MAG: alpha-1,6-glucosidase domain-containing protein [Pseudomonadota bacterium]